LHGFNSKTILKSFSSWQMLQNYKLKSGANKYLWFLNTPFLKKKKKSAQKCASNQPDRNGLRSSPCDSGGNAQHLRSVATNVRNFHREQKTIWKVNVGPSTFTMKQLSCYEILKKFSDLGRFFDTTQGTEGGYEIWNLEHSNSLRGNILGNKFKILVPKPERKDSLETSE
jgi:hypothetical protein